MLTLLFPGRHIIQTRFQEQYLVEHLPALVEQMPLLGQRRLAGTIGRIVFAITSANQSHSRYNPVPLHVRAIGVDRFAARLRERQLFDYRIVPVPHFNPTDRFAAFLLKEIHEATDGELSLAPDNTVVLSSTPHLIQQFLALGFRVLPAEMESLSPERYRAQTPAEVLKRVAGLDAWDSDVDVLRLLSDSTWDLWSTFPDVPRRILRLYRDPLLTEQGGLTEMRNYSVYAAGLNERAALVLKYEDIRRAVVPGKIVDEGCADGALLVPLARDFPDSDLIGLEITGEFFARCLERQRAMEFGGTYVHFHQRNITEPVFEPGSIDTTICNSTTHELWSYGRRTRRCGHTCARSSARPAAAGASSSATWSDPAARSARCTCGATTPTARATTRPTPRPCPRPHGSGDSRATSSPSCAPRAGANHQPPCATVRRR